MKTNGFAIACVIAGVLTAPGGAGRADAEHARTVEHASSKNVDVIVSLNEAAGELPEGITVPLSGPHRNRIFFTLVFRVQVLRVNGSSYEPWATIADPTNRLGLGLATDDDGNIYWAIGALGPGSSPPGIYKIPPHGGMATLLTPPGFPAALPNGIDIIGERAYWTDRSWGPSTSRISGRVPLAFGAMTRCSPEIRLRVAAGRPFRWARMASPTTTIRST